MTLMSVIAAIVEFKNMNYKVYIPSKGRAGKVTTDKLFLDSTIVCPESEVKEYKKQHDRDWEYKPYSPLFLVE